MSKENGPKKSDKTKKIEASILETKKKITKNEKVGEELAKDKEELIKVGKEMGLSEVEIEEMIKNGVTKNKEVNDIKNKNSLSIKTNVKKIEDLTKNILDTFEQEETIVEEKREELNNEPIIAEKGSRLQSLMKSFSKFVSQKEVTEPTVAEVTKPVVEVKETEPVVEVKEPVTESENAGIEDATAEVIETKVITTPEQRDENDINKSKKLLEERLGEKEKSIASIADLVLLAEDVYLNEDPELQKFALELWKSDKVIEEIGNGSKNMDEEKIKEVIDRISNICGDKNLFINEIKKLKEKSEETKKPIVGAVEDTAQNPEDGEVVIENKDTSAPAPDENKDATAAPTSTTPGLDEKAVATKEIIDSGVFVMPANRGFWEKMSEKGRSVVSALYKSINPIPGLSRLVAKMGIGYNQKWIELKEEKSAELKDKMDSLDLNIKTSNQSKVKMTEIMENLKKSGNPGYATMAIEIKKMERAEAKLGNKRNNLQSRLEKRENTTKLYTNKRDAIADKMIGKYERNLSPIEGKLDVIHNEREKMDLFILGREVEMQAEEADCKNLEDTKNSILEALMSAGKSDKKAGRDRTVKSLEKQIETRREKIAKNRAGLEKKQRESNERIAEVDAQAQPYRDRRDQFVRVKEGRPIDFNLQERSALKNNKIMEETSSHPRTTEESTVDASLPMGTIDTSGDTSSTENASSLSNRISNYNEYVKKNNLKKDLQIDIDVLRKGLGLNKETVISVEMYKKILEQHYKVKKIPENDYKKLLGNIK